MQDLPSDVIEAKAEDLARTFAGALKSQGQISEMRSKRSKMQSPLLANCLTDATALGYRRENLSRTEMTVLQAMTTTTPHTL